VEPATPNSRACSALKAFDDAISHRQVSNLDRG
jgi:hypothetical protein